MSDDEEGSPYVKMLAETLTGPAEKSTRDILRQQQRSNNHVASKANREIAALEKQSADLQRAISKAAQRSDEKELRSLARKLVVVRRQENLQQNVLKNVEQIGDHMQMAQATLSVNQLFVGSQQAIASVNNAISAVDIQRTVLLFQQNQKAMAARNQISSQMLNEAFQETAGADDVQSEVDEIVNKAKDEQNMLQEHQLASLPVPKSNPGRSAAAANSAVKLPSDNRPPSPPNIAPICFSDDKDEAQEKKEPGDDSCDFQKRIAERMAKLKGENK